MDLSEAALLASRLYFCVYIPPVKDRGIIVSLKSLFFFFFPNSNIINFLFFLFTSIKIHVPKY